MIDDVLRDDLVFSDVEQKEVFFLRNDPSAVCQRFVQVAGLPPDRRFVRKFFRIGIADDEAGDISDVIQRLCHGRFLSRGGFVVALYRRRRNGVGDYIEHTHQYPGL